MPMASNAIIDSVTARGCITDSDVLKMRRAYSADASITEGEVSELLQLNQTCVSQTVTWTQFFAETISNFILQQTTPDGRISETNARWLASRITRDGKISDAEHAVLCFIKQKLPIVDPTLRPLLDRVA
jgi:hypothetical protein